MRTNKGQTMLMELKLFTDLIDALGKAAGGLKPIFNLPKAEREAMRRTPNDTSGLGYRRPKGEGGLTSIARRQDCRWPRDNTYSTVEAVWIYFSLNGGGNHPSNNGQTYRLSTPRSIW